jgi:hypothetical protein
VNATATKTRTAMVGRKYESYIVNDEERSALPHACFKIVPLGHHDMNMIVRLPCDRRSTFQDLRREIEEDYSDDLPFYDFKFALTDDWMAVSVSPAQEEKWRICDFILKNTGGGDGTYENPHVVYIKSVRVESLEEEKVG